MRILFVILFIFSTSLAFSQIKFPEADLEKGYTNSQEVARVAFPLNNQARVWVKGSSTHSIASILDTKTSEIIATVQLAPPFYTEVILVPWGTLEVSFCNTTNCKPPIRIDTSALPKR